MDDRLLLGSYYTTEECDADMQLPVVCKLLEADLCLAEGELQNVLSKLFFENCKIIGEIESSCLTLVESDPIRDVIRGYGFENSLFYVGKVSRAG